MHEIQSHELVGKYIMEQCDVDFSHNKIVYPNTIYLTISMSEMCTCEQRRRTGVLGSGVLGWIVRMHVNFPYES